MGLSGRVPARVDAATKACVLDLLEEATGQGWPLRRACHELELPERRAHRWLPAHRWPARRPGAGRGADARAAARRGRGDPGDEWGEVDRRHRKLAHRGSYLRRFWVSPSSVRRVLHLATSTFGPYPGPGRSVRRQFPDWVDYTPNSIWIYDTERHEASCNRVEVRPPPRDRRSDLVKLGAA